MSQLLDLIASRLLKVRRVSDGLVAQCPVCAAEGRDSKGAHLKVFASGAFGCVAHPDDKVHSRAIYSIIRDKADPESLLCAETEWVIPEKVTTPTVYPESDLSKLLPDHGYWVNRGMKDEVLVRLGGGLAPANERSKLSNRYVFPLRDDHGQIVGWSGRLVDDNSFGPRWKHLNAVRASVFPHVSLVQPAARARREVILVEGIGCCLALMGAGLDQCLCLFGTHISSKLIGLLLAWAPKRVIIATNNEPSGIGNRAAESVYAKLIPFLGPDVPVIHLPSRKDFAEMSGEEIGVWHAGLDAPAPPAPQEGSSS